MAYKIWSYFTLPKEEANKTLYLICNLNSQSKLSIKSKQIRSRFWTSVIVQQICFFFSGLTFISLNFNGVVSICKQMYMPPQLEVILLTANTIVSVTVSETYPSKGTLLISLYKRYFTSWDYLSILTLHLLNSLSSFDSYRTIFLQSTVLISIEY